MLNGKDNNISPIVLWTDWRTDGARGKLNKSVFATKSILNILKIYNTLLLNDLNEFQYKVSPVRSDLLDLIIYKIKNSLEIHIVNKKRFRILSSRL